MGNREDRQARLAFRGVQYLLNIERLSFHPTTESRRGEQIIERHRQLLSILKRIERLDILDSDFRHWRRLNLLNQTGNVQILTVHPGAVENH